MLLKNANEKHGKSVLVPFVSYLRMKFCQENQKYKTNSILVSPKDAAV